MWSDEREELRQAIKETLITTAEWLAVWSAMMAMLVSIIF